MYGKAGSTWDPISFSRGSIESHVQDHLRNSFSTLIDTGVDVLRWANESKPELAKVLVSQWIDSSSTLLKRLAIFGVGDSNAMSAEETDTKALVTLEGLRRDALGVR